MDKHYYQDEEFENLRFEEDDEPEFEKPEGNDGKGPGALKKIAAIVVVFTILFAVWNYGFRLDEVRVIGNKNYTSNEIKSLIGFPEDASNTLLCYLKYIRYKMDEIPFLEGVKVKMENRNVICIEVDETHILACIKEGKKYYYFDERGVVQEVLSERKETIPVVDGMNATILELGENISVEDEDQTIYNALIQLCELLSDNQIKAQKIEVSSDKRFTVYVNDAIRIGFGSPVHLEEKVIEAANILPDLEEMQKTEDIQGILHLENYDSTKNSIVFTKENSN